MIYRSSPEIYKASQSRGGSLTAIQDPHGLSDESVRNQMLYP